MTSVINGASDQGVGFFFNTFKRGQRTQIETAIDTEVVSECGRVRCQSLIQGLHKNAFVTKTRPSTTSDLAMMNPLWTGISFYETDTCVLHAHLDQLQRNADQELQDRDTEARMSKRLS